MSWAPTVRVANDPKFYTNALRYATREEALADAKNLSQRWTAVVAHGAEERADPVNRRWEPGLGSVLVVTDGLSARPVEGDSVNE
jgi:hypothetical protein